ncbi:MAG: hypothetical protein IKR48_08980 [Kiritimatiellae bacterium]|nr:hypothetical protein [Kiritimatiellia bacterium]
MKWLTIPLFALFLFSSVSCTTRSEVSHDETRFIPKTYRARDDHGGKLFEGKSYSASSYRSTGSSYAPSHEQEWKSAEQGNTANASPFESKSVAQGEKYVQRKTTKVCTFQAPPDIAPERKPYVKGTEDLAAKEFQAAEKKAGYDPMLRPRQGIKEEHLNERNTNPQGIVPPRQAR